MTKHISTATPSTSAVRAVAGYTDGEIFKIAHGIANMAMYYPGASYALTAEGNATIYRFAVSRLRTNSAPVVAFAVMNWLENYPGEELSGKTGIFAGLDMCALNAARFQAQEAERQGVNA